MIAMQMTSPDASRRRTPRRSTAANEQDGERSGTLPAVEPQPSLRNFQPLDPGVVSEAIPAFFIGRNKDGFWVAREVKGRSVDFSCLRTPHCRLQEGTASREDAQPSFYPSGLNSTSRTKAIRSSRSLDC